MSDGPTPYRSRLRIEGEYRLDPGGSGRKLERRIAEDIDPVWFTVHIGEADSDPESTDEWIPLAREFFASRDVEYVMLRDDEGTHRVRIQHA